MSHDQWSYAWGSEKYKASKFYKFFFRGIQPHEAFGLIWSTKCIPKIKFFCWLLLSDRLNTKNMLKRRCFNIGTNFQCQMCNIGVEETLEHLFFQCPFSRSCWDRLGMTMPVATREDRFFFITQARASWTKPLFYRILFYCSLEYLEREKQLVLH